MAGCVGIGMPSRMNVIEPQRADLYSVAVISHIKNTNAPVHIYIEGDGRSFDMFGRATRDPTPRSNFMRDMASADTSPNVAYIARPCQFVMDTKCNLSDWTDGRFSQTMVDSVASAIRSIANNRPVILIGYSGGAMISGLVIQTHPEIDVKQWITIAGVLNHTDWTNYFGDTPLIRSQNMNTLPQITQIHYVAQQDKTVPYSLSKKWIGENKMITIPDADHNSIPIMKLDFID